MAYGLWLMAYGLGLANELGHSLASSCATTSIYSFDIKALLCNN